MQLEQRGNGTFSNTWQIEMQEALCRNPICEPAPPCPLWLRIYGRPASCELYHPSCVLSPCLAAPDTRFVRLQTASAAASSRALLPSLPPPAPAPPFVPGFPARGSVTVRGSSRI